MELQNFECQIAKAQIARYVAGDRLSDEAMAQLESHVATCKDCKQNLAERKAVLQAVLSPSSREELVDEPQAPQKTPRIDLAQFIKSKMLSKEPAQAAVRTETSKTTAFTKPAIYSIGLGIVLIGMSYASKNMGSVLGPKAADAAAAAPTKSPISKAPTPVTKPQAPALKTISKPAPKPISASTVPKPTPKPAAKKPSDEPTSTTRHHRRHQDSNPQHDSVKIYDPENQP